MCFHSIANNSAAVTWGCLVALILVGVILFVLLYYRRQVSSLKTTIAHVQYIPEPQQQLDRDHFDNPVYALQLQQTRNDPTLVNNTRQQKVNGLDRYKLGYSDSSSNASSRGMCIIFKVFKFVLNHWSSDVHLLKCSLSTAGTYSTNYGGDIHHKNLLADATNPNEYHSIDESNIEHLYDEITHKEGYKDPGKWCSWHQQYHRMLIFFTPFQMNTSIWTFLVRAVHQSRIIIEWTSLISQPRKTNWKRSISNGIIWMLPVEHWWTIIRLIPMKAQVPIAHTDRLNDGCEYTRGWKQSYALVPFLGIKNKIDDVWTKSKFPSMC